MKEIQLFAEKERKNIDSITVLPPPPSVLWKVLIIKPGNIYVFLSAAYFVNCLLIFFAALTPGSGESCMFCI